MDSTFKICNGTVYKQLLTICILVSKESDGSGHGQLYCLPVAFFYLRKKSKATYVRALNCIKVLSGNWLPQACHVDLELAESRAILEVWPTCRIHLCLFHLRQAHFRKLNQLHIAKYVYNSNSEYNAFWCLVKALSYLNLSDQNVKMIAVDIIDSQIQNMIKAKLPGAVKFKSFVNDYLKDKIFE